MVKTKKFSPESEEFKFFQEYWKFIQAFNMIEERGETDQDWEMLIYEADQLCRKYGNKKFYREMVMAHINEIERKVKEERNHGKKQFFFEPGQDV